VSLHVKWLFGRLDWIPEALSTFKPATSPRLTKVHLGFDYPLDQIESQNSHDHSELEDLDRELHWIARELARIEREYEGTVNIVVMMGEEFGLFTEVDVRVHLRRVVSDLANSRFLPTDLTALVLSIG
jgi:hypothetical protein